MILNSGLDELYPQIITNIWFWDNKTPKIVFFIILPPMRNEFTFWSRVTLSSQHK